MDFVAIDERFAVFLTVAETIYQLPEPLSRFGFGL